MKELDWRIVVAESALIAYSGEEQVWNYYVFRSHEYPGNWIARFQGREIALGTLLKCLAACEKAEAGPRKSLGPATHGPDRVSADLADEFWRPLDDVEPKSAAELIKESGNPNMLAKTQAEQSLTPGELGLPTERQKNPCLSCGGQGWNHPMQSGGGYGICDKIPCDACHGSGRAPEPQTCPTSPPVRPDVPA